MTTMPSVNGAITAFVSALVIALFNVLEAFDVYDFTEGQVQAVTIFVSLVIAAVLLLTNRKPKEEPDG